MGAFFCFWIFGFWVAGMSFLEYNKIKEIEDSFTSYLYLNFRKEGKHYDGRKFKKKKTDIVGSGE